MPITTNVVSSNLIWNFLYPSKSNQDIWGKLETSIEMAINDTTIDDVIITGDYNDNQNSCTIKDELPFN
jgi:hypothetical protein